MLSFLGNPSQSRIYQASAVKTQGTSKIRSYDFATFECDSNSDERKKAVHMFKKNKAYIIQ